jgi:uncharacterized protein (DUF3084 family)
MRSSELECALLALDEMRRERDEARLELKVMTEEHRLACEDRDLMQRERDEARRKVCALEADTTEDQREYAKQRGWDCFGTNTCKEAQHDLEADTHTG